MNKFLWFNRKLMAWGNPNELEDLIKNGKNIGFWESFGWKKENDKEDKKK